MQIFFLGIVAAAVAVVQSDGDSSAKPAPISDPVKSDEQECEYYQYTLKNVPTQGSPGVDIRNVSISECTTVDMPCNRPCWVYYRASGDFIVKSSTFSDFDYGNFSIDGKFVKTTDFLRVVTDKPYEPAQLNRTQTNDGTTHEPPTSDHCYRLQVIPLSIVVVFLVVLLIAFFIAAVIFCGYSSCVRGRLCEQCKKLEPCIEPVVKKCCGWKKSNNQLPSSMLERNVQLHKSVSETDKTGENPRRRNAQNTVARGSSPNGGRDEWVVSEDSQASVKLEHIHGDESSSDNPVSPPISMETSPPVVKETQLTMTCVQPTSKPGHSSQSHTFTSSYSDN